MDCTVNHSIEVFEGAIAWLPLELHCCNKTKAQQAGLDG